MIRKQAIGRIRCIYTAIAFPFFLLAHVFLVTQARADLMVSPTRVDLNDTQKQAVVILRNVGQSELAYRIDWSERQITDEGEMRTLPKGTNPKSIAKMVRFSPRRVVVQPGQNQTIRLDYRPPQNLAEGEYRSHLSIRAEPPAVNPVAPKETEKPPEIAKETGQAEEKPKGLSFKMEVLLSYSLPVVVRRGVPSVEVAITGVKPEMVNRGEEGMHRALRIDMTRSGAFGTMGRISVYQQMDANAAIVDIGQPALATLYQEVSRQSNLVLLKPDAVLRPGSWIRIAYEGQGSDAGKVFAERTFRVGNE
jgi:fimbrial chaperone protein